MKHSQSKIGEPDWSELELSFICSPFGTSIGEKNMELNAETLSYLMNAVLLPSLGYLIVRARKYTPQIVGYVRQLSDLRVKTKTILNIMGMIYAIASKVDKYEENDGEIDTKEAKDLLVDIKALANSPDVKKLREELSA